ncbi:MAG: BamA/TamA family outer membrane protein [Spirosomataceae bacterium]
MLLLSIFSTFWLSQAGVPTDTTQKVVVRQVTLSGNFRTRDRIIRREMDVHAGDTLTFQQLDSLLEYDRRKITNTNLFVTVALKKQLVADTTNLSFYTNDGQIVAYPKTIDLEVAVKEQWYLLAFPVFELADRNFNEWWYERGRDFGRINYGLYTLHQNLTGNNDRLRIRAEFGFIPRLDIYYSTPYLGKKQKLGMTVGIVRLTNRTLGYRTNADKLQFLPSETRNRERISPYVSFTYRPQFYGFHSLTLQYSHTQVADTIARLNPRYLLSGNTNQHYFQLSYGYAFDRRDRVQYPLRGFYATFGITKTGFYPWRRRKAMGCHELWALCAFGQTAFF